MRITARVVPEWAIAGPPNRAYAREPVVVPAPPTQSGLHPLPGRTTGGTLNTSYRRQSKGRHDASILVRDLCLVDPVRGHPRTDEAPVLSRRLALRPPPEPELGDLVAWRDADLFRFANRLEGWIETDDQGQISGHGYSGGGLIGSTTLRLGRSSATFAAIPYPDLGAVSTDHRRATGAPMPRTVNRPPFVQFSAPTVWTTLELTLHADVRAEGQMTGASPFPRHWVYDDTGALVGKSGLTDFSGWSKEYFGDHSPWGEVDNPALVTVAETALERTLSTTIMRGGAKPRIRTVAAGAELVRQGEPGDELFLLLDGVLEVLVDGSTVAELGPGAVGGERALLEGGARTSTLRALTKVRVAVASAEQVDIEALRELAEGHRREERRDNLNPPPRPARETSAVRGTRLDTGTRAGLRAVRRQHLLRRSGP